MSWIDTHDITRAARKRSIGADVAEAIDRIRALAMTAEAAQAELDAMGAGALPESGEDESAALDRLVTASDALVTEVRAADAALSTLGDASRALAEISG